MGSMLEHILVMEYERFALRARAWQRGPPGSTKIDVGLG